MPRGLEKMNNNDPDAAKSRNNRIVQLLMLISGLAFIIVGAFLLISGDGEAETHMLILAVALIIVGFSDLVLAFFVFRGAYKSLNSAAGGEDQPATPPWQDDN